MAALPVTRADGAFPGFNGRIAFITGNRIRVVTAGGTSIRVLPPRGETARVSWSPDGRRLLISKDRIYLTGAGAVRLIPLPILHRWRHAPPDAAWAPSGKTIVFIADSGRCSGLFSFRLGDRRERRLIPGCADATHPTWSHDGRYIAYEGEDSTICVLQLSTGARPCITTGESPDWSPSTDRLAFTQGRSIVLFNILSGDRERLNLTTDDPQESLDWPVWSPDGSKLAFVRDELAAKYEEHLYIANIDGSEIARVGNTSYDERPDWQPVR